jgi:hypothetical protein
MNINTGDQIKISPQDGPVIHFHDPEGILKTPRLDNGTLIGTASENAGDHELFAQTVVGQTTQWQLCKLHTTDQGALKSTTDAMVSEVPKAATWETIDLDPIVNADVRQIFEQKYLSPRPNTCSLRLATDGYSTWQMVLDPKNKVPAINFSSVKSLLDKQGRLTTKAGVPFAWTTGQKNIAFTSQWDNFPKQVEVPVNKAGEAVWLLVCGSTNPMECGISNAEIRLNYADNSVDKIELIPPFNFWSLCPFGHVDYNYQRDGFCLPKTPPEMMELGDNCRAIVVNHRLKPGAILKSVTLETLSEQVVIGLMGATVMNPR